MAGEQAFLDARLELFFGEASDAVAHVYARLTGMPDSGWTLGGSLVGPTCRYADTLPARFPLVDRGPGESLLAQAVIPEPSFWTLELPQLYEAEVQLSCKGRTVATVRRPFGICRLGAVDGKLIFGGKRWVPRGVDRLEVPSCGLDEWREASAAMLVRNPSDQLCDEAARVGVLVIAQLDRADDDAIRRLARAASVGIIVVPAGTSFGRVLAHNVVFAERFAPDQPVRPAPWAPVALVEVGRPDELPARLAGCREAVIPLRPMGLANNLAEARAECDRLQRDLAGIHDWAGYIV